MIQSFPEQAIHVSGLCFVSATGLFVCFCFFDICVYCGHRHESPDLVCVLCDKVLKWMELTSLKNCICNIWSEFSSLISADQCSVCAQVFNQTKGG